MVLIIIQEKRFGFVRPVRIQITVFFRKVAVTHAGNDRRAVVAVAFVCIRQKEAGDGVVGVRGRFIPEEDLHAAVSFIQILVHHRVTLAGDLSLNFGGVVV